MKTQIVYATNIDVGTSIEKIADSNLIIWEISEKNIVWFQVKGTKTVFTLSPRGKLQVKWEDPEEKRILLKVVKSILAPKQGEKLSIKPIRQQAFVTYPPPEKFRLYWCDEITEYERQTLQKELYGDAFMAALSSGKFVLATVGKSKIQREVYEMRWEQIERYLQNSSLSTRLATRGEEARFFLTNLVSEFSENAQEFSVMILQSKEGTRVQLTEEEMLNLLGKTEKRNLIRGVFNARWNLARSHPTKDNLPIADQRFGETWIVLRWKPAPRLSRKKLHTVNFARVEKCFIEWLRQFKGLSYNKKLVDHAMDPGLGTADWLSATDHLSSEDKKKFSLLREKYSEYRRKKSKFETIYFRGL